MKTVAKRRSPATVPVNQPVASGSGAATGASTRPAATVPPKAAVATSGRAELFGVPLDLLTMQQTVERCRELIEARRPVQHVVLNAGKSVAMQDIPKLREIIEQCDLVNADGQSVVWAGRLLGLPVPERVTGIDLMEQLLALAEKKDYPVFFLGATQDVLDAFVVQVKRRLPALEIAGARNGYFGNDAEVAAAIASSGARILMVGMSSPRKELFLAEQLPLMGGIFAMGVGGSFDVWAGKTRRAPVWMQRAGLEWFYRLLQEPGRMWKRYLVGNTRFMLLVAREWVARRRPAAAAAAGAAAGSASAAGAGAAGRSTGAARTTGAGRPAKAEGPLGEAGR
jgi:N-acetylglucosaminyldiphosphoundecaprenol N-acetyl-beta-D-mannosaminyltransferase